MKKEGRWRGFLRDLGFRLEQFLARSAYSKIAVLWFVLAVMAFVGGALAWLTPALSFPDLGDAFWWAFLRISDPGYLADDDAPGVRLVSVLMSMVGLALYVGVLIAIITQSFTKQMERISRGLTPVRFVGHVVVLGWTNRTLELVAELLEGRDDPPHVVVLVEQITAEIEQALVDRLPRRLRSQVVLRTGDPERLEDLARVRGDRAEAIVIPGEDVPDRDPGMGDPRVLKVIASIEGAAGRPEGPRPRLVAEILDPALIPVAHSAYRGPMQILASETLIGRSLALGILSPGLSLALGDIVDVRSGSTLRVERHPALAGESIIRATSRLPTAVLLGALRDEAGRHHVVSAHDAVLQEDDLLLLLARPGPVAAPLETPPTGTGSGSVPEEGVGALATRRVLLVGWSGKAVRLCRVLAEQSEHRVEIDLLSRLEAASREALLAEVSESLTVRHLVGDPASPTTFGALDLSGYDCVALMGSDTASDRFEADSRTITCALLLLSQLHGATARPHVIAEILDPANRAVLEGRGVELVVTSELVARVLVGAVAHPELSGIFESMVQGKLGRIGVNSLANVAASEGTTFGYLEASLRRRDIICLGLHREATGFAPELLPDKQEPLSLGPHDRALVVRRRPESETASAAPEGGGGR